MSTNAPPPPATPGGEVASLLDCLRVDVMPAAFVIDGLRAEFARLSRALTASEEARKAAERERDLLMLDTGARLDGYRELGAQTAAALNERDAARRAQRDLEADRDRLKRELDSEVSLNATTIDLLHLRLEGTPEAELDEPMPRQARRAAKLIDRLRADLGADPQRQEHRELHRVEVAADPVLQQRVPGRHLPRHQIERRAVR